MDGQADSQADSQVDELELPDLEPSGTLWILLVRTWSGNTVLLIGFF